MAQLYTGSVLLRLVGQLDLQGKSQGSALRLTVSDLIAITNRLTADGIIIP